ncbi:MULTISPECIES: pyridoxamine 5'-phosphate oxidase family protein [unclassified Bacillus (in: firmicutes)]|uniref:pyridoxamine 5'-phosphate oxidase family protein n=1 Tax=unclassified Bacillus (in: firmicutes) TaxID=185979 RepID=UPI0008E4DF54|nr:MULTISPECIES: pyridoxamine 5'-phosphate oxidase family protein [unclassified Bacillus (in: firmicutes)]SFA88038.1 General stress protein 26 [Bacillus sp. UNCCL13]SFQ84494.1 General stress protein 26 [Bacillus sp. cl95]
MDNLQLRQEVVKVLDESKVGTLSTVQNNKPHSRYMTFFHEDLTLYTPTSKETHKAEEISNNPNVHILLGYAGDEYGDAYVEVEGTAKLNDTEELKKKLWNEHFEKWFEGPEDPNYVVLEIKPLLVRLMNKEDKEPQTLQL